MRFVHMSLIVLVVVAFSSIAQSDPPSNEAELAKATSGDKIDEVLHTILKRLDAIEKRLSAIEHQLASLRSLSIPENVERGMQLDAIERQRRLIEPLRIQPLDEPERYQPLDEPER